jgi:rare lipoprotein A
MVDGSTKTMMLRVSLAAAFLFGGSLTAALAANDTVPAPVQAETPEADPNLPRFELQSELEQTEFASTPVVQAVPEVSEESSRELGSGVASWYGAEFAGRKTASGERFNPGEYTAAHRTLPFGSKVRVSRGDKSVVVRINDRGPFHGGRVIDLSRAAAAELGIVSAGRGEVTLALVD